MDKSPPPIRAEMYGYFTTRADSARISGICCLQRSQLGSLHALV